MQIIIQTTTFIKQLTPKKRNKREERLKEREKEGDIEVERLVWTDGWTEGITSPPLLPSAPVWSLSTDKAHGAGAPVENRTLPPYKRPGMISRIGIP